MKKIAIVGAGYAGLATAWVLLQSSTQTSPIQVTLFDEGKSASSASTGLLHPFPGRTGARSWLASEGMAATCELLAVAEQELGSSVASRTGLLRKAWAPWQEKEFRKLAKKDVEAVWRDDGLWIPSAIAVYSKPYMAGLQAACLSKGAIHQRRRVDCLEELADFDAIILATGAETLHYELAKELPLVPVKGQALLCRWGKARLEYSIAGNGHITPTEDPDLCLIGSTYEHEFTDDRPDPAIIPILLEKAAKFYPPASEFEVVDVLAGIRMTTKEGYRPLVQQLTPKVYAFTGLGSRGLLYHALLARRLSAALLTSSSL